MDKEEAYIGYLRYTGQSVENGLLDIKKSAEALLGFDEVLRYFLIKEDPRLLGYDFEIPVRIKKGSWEAAIPEVIDKLFSPAGIGYAALGTYATVTASKAAQEGLFSTGLVKDIKGTFKAALKSVQWVIKIGSRIGMLKKNLNKVKLSSNGEEILVPDDQGIFLTVSKKYFDRYVECPPRLFSKNAKIIDKNRVLEFGVYDAGKEEKVRINESEKQIYYIEGEENEIILPELTDGQQVELEGIITRGNEKTNTVGFEYKEHILTCIPQEGSITVYKTKIISHLRNHIFPRVIMKGTVDRVSIEAQFKEKKPRIIFSDIIPLEKEESDLKLL